MSINLPSLEGTSENVRRILRSQRIRSTFCNKTLFLKKEFIFFRPKDQKASEDKFNIAYKIDCSNCKVIKFVKNCDCEKLKSQNIVWK